MLPQYDTWSMFKKSLQNFARPLKGDTLHLLKRTASTKTCLIVGVRKSDSASRTGIQNPGVGRKMLLRKKIVGNWHVITLQEASEYVDHDTLTNRFHVTHHGGCAILYNKDTFHPNIDVRSILPS